MPVTIVTSFSPTRLNRQKHCLETWRQLKCNVIGIQTAGEIESLRRAFTGVTFQETDRVGDAFGRPELVRIAAVFDIAKTVGNILVMNSDIHVSCLQKVFEDEWGIAKPNELKIGIRWEMNPKIRQKRMFKWGVDVFLVTPQLAEELPDIGLAMGCPVWDYWVPWKAHSLGYKITTLKKPHFIHESHSPGWSKQEYNTGFNSVIAGHCTLNEQQLTRFIQIKTGRMDQRARKRL